MMNFRVVLVRHELPWTTLFYFEPMSSPNNLINLNNPDTEDQALICPERGCLPNSQIS